MPRSSKHIAPDVLRLFWRHPDDDPFSIRHKLLDAEKGPYLYFRRIKTNLQARFAQLFDPHTLPQVFLHGSPHIDNYAKTLTGAGMIDFDRAHTGPYAWDIVCLLLSLSLREIDTLSHFVTQAVVEALKAGYLKGFQAPELGFQEYSHLSHVHPEDWEKNTRAYLAANKKWAKKLREHPLPINDPVACEVLSQYLFSRQAHSMLTDYRVSEIAHCAGTFGRPRFLFVLLPKASLKTSPKAMPKLFDIKQTRNYDNPAWLHNRWYHHAFDHQAKRMIAAAQLYAPHCINGEGYATVNGVEYWGREVPTLNRKPSKLMSVEQQIDFAFSAANQLGRGHRLSLPTATLAPMSSDEFIRHFHTHYGEWVKITQQLHHELVSTWKIYAKTFGSH